MVEVGISPEAEEVAEIVDRLQPSYRQDVLRFARLTLETQPKPASVSAADAQYTRSLLNTLRRHGGDELAKQVLREFVLQHPALLRELGGLLDGPLGGVELGNQRTNTKYSAG